MSLKRFSVTVLHVAVFGTLQTSSCSAVVDNLRPTRKYYFRLFAISSSRCLGVSTVSRSLVLSRGSSAVQLPVTNSPW